MRAQLKHRNFRLRVGFGKQADALHVLGGGRRAGNVDADGHGVAVVHQAAIVNSTRPACTGAPPVKTLMAMRNISGMAWACSNRCQITRPVPPCSVLCSQRRRFAFMRSFQRLQIGDHVFDLLRVQSRASSCADSTGAGRPPAAAIAPLRSGCQHRPAVTPDWPGNVLRRSACCDAASTSFTAAWRRWRGHVARRPGRRLQAGACCRLVWLGLLDLVGLLQARSPPAPSSAP